MAASLDTAIILAGGFGTRLQQVVSDVPKCLAPIADKPFLHYLIAGLEQQGIRQFIFSLGYKHEQVVHYLQTAQAHRAWKVVVEHEPLGTGGAIRYAAQVADAEQVVVVNGDTWFDVDLQVLAHDHTQANADATLALKRMSHVDRYGLVEVDNRGFVAAFREKQFTESGLINGGVYVINVNSFMQDTPTGNFSMEQAYLTPRAGKQKLFGSVHEGYFIDIGIPEDFERATHEFPRLFNANS